MVLKEDLEPQSELEESKNENDFTAAVTKECNNFLAALVNYEIVQVKDISDLTKANTEHQLYIERFGKFQGEFQNGFKAIFKQADEKIAVLEKEFADSRLLTSKILLQIKGIFLEALAKLMGTP